MTKIIYLCVGALVIFMFSCKKDSVVYEKINYGVYTGIRINEFPSSKVIYIDTITLTLDSIKYSYHSNTDINYGAGTYKVVGDSIEFSDQIDRMTLYGVYYILQGNYSFRTSADSLYFEKHNVQGSVICRLKKRQ